MPHKKTNNTQNTQVLDSVKQLTVELDKHLRDLASRKKQFNEFEIFLTQRLAAYLLYKVATREQQPIPSFQDIIKGKFECCEDAVYLCQQHFDKEFWEAISALLKKFPSKLQRGFLDGKNISNN